MTATTKARRGFDWFFRNPDTGGLAIWQMPNLPLAIFLVAAAIRRFAHLHGGVRTTVSVIATVALLWWAGDEVLRGDSPFRRVLGGLVIAATLFGIVRQLTG
jgi:hypothetical protein